MSLSLSIPISLILGILKLKFGTRVTASQKDYLKWRRSAEGKKHFSRIENNIFWAAIMRGHTSVISTSIKEKQDDIKRLKRDLGLNIIPWLIFSCILITGCTTTYTIPKETPTYHEGSLLEGEETYVVRDLKVKAPTGEKKSLRGDWYVVSDDFIKKHKANQDTLVESMEALKHERMKGGIAGGVVVLGFFIVLVSVIKRLNSRVK